MRVFQALKGSRQMQASRSCSLLATVQKLHSFSYISEHFSSSEARQLAGSQHHILAGEGQVAARNPSGSAVGPKKARRITPTLMPASELGNGQAAEARPQEPLNLPSTDIRFPKNRSGAADAINTAANEQKSTITSPGLSLAQIAAFAGKSAAKH